MREEKVTYDSLDVEYTQPAIIGSDSALHTAGDVWLLGEGPGSEVVRGYLDNTDIFRIMARSIDPQWQNPPDDPKSNASAAP